MQEYQKVTQVNYKEDIEQRIDKFLHNHFVNIPKSHVYKLLRTGQVRVNKKRVKPDYRLNRGDMVRIPPYRISTPDEIDQEKLAQKRRSYEKYDIDVLYQDENYLIVNKPSDLAVHGGSGLSLGLIEIIRSKYGDHVELVHRLDKGTSGCLILALNRRALVLMNEMLRERKVTKIYHALVDGYTRDKFSAKESLKKILTFNNEKIVKVDVDGQSALTKFTTIIRSRTNSLLRAEPITGRTHQIRVHLKQHASPIVGDEKYGGSTATRLCLHAYQLNFDCPVNNFNISVQAPYDKRMIKIMKDKDINIS